MNAPMFDFDNPLGSRNRQSVHRSAIDGMTMTVYDSRFSVTNNVLEALDCPDRINIIYNDFLDAFIIYADPDGMAVRKSGTSKQFNAKNVKKVLIDRGYDFSESFFRSTDGRRYGKGIVFSAESMIAVKREVRNG